MGNLRLSAPSSAVFLVAMVALSCMLSSALHLLSHCISVAMMCGELDDARAKLFVGISKRHV